MPDDIELQARRLNEADRALRKFIENYREEGYTREEIEDRFDEVYSEDEE